MRLYASDDSHCVRARGAQAPSPPQKRPVWSDSRLCTIAQRGRTLWQSHTCAHPPSLLQQELAVLQSPNPTFLQFHAPQPTIHDRDPSIALARTPTVFGPPALPCAQGGVPVPQGGVQ